MEKGEVFAGQPPRLCETGEPADIKQTRDIYVNSAPGKFGQVKG